MDFTIALSNVLLTLFYIIPGYVICKMKKTLPEHLPGLSGVLIYIGTPFLEISAFISLDYSPKLATNMGIVFLIATLLQGSFMLIFYLLFVRKKSNGITRIMNIGAIVGNVGFFGLPVLTALLPEYPEVSAYVTMYMVSMNLIMFTLGVFFLTNDKKYISLRAAVFNPTLFGLLIALPIFFFGLKEYIPAVFVSGIKTISSMTAPLCMFILGVRLAATPIKKILKCRFAFIIALLKLMVFPLFCFALTYFLPIGFEMRGVLVILSGMPCAAILQSMAELHHIDATAPAYSILTSTLLSFITIPMLTFLVANA